MMDNLDNHTIDKLKDELKLEKKAYSKQTKETEKRTAELLVANKELAFQNEEKEKRAAELLIANKELALQNEEKEKRAADLLIANEDLAFQNGEKGKGGGELRIANEALAFQNEEKIKKAAELLAANKEISAQAKLIEMQRTCFVDKQLLAKTLDCIGDAVISTDDKKNIVLLNKVAESLTGWKQEDAVGVSVDRVFNIINERTRKKRYDFVASVMKSGKTHKLTNHTILIQKNGKEILIEDSAAPIFNEINEIVGVVIVFRDFSEKWERLKKSECVSFHDELTGLYNRRFYEDEIKRIDIKSNLPLSLIMADVNGLKLINDSFGHDVGDELLVKTANAMQLGCRTNDIVARLGGDEFIIALPNSNAENTANVVNRIKQLLKDQKVNGLEISISFGFDTKAEEQEDIQDIFKKTEDRMYRHKIYESASIRSETINLIKSTLFAKNNRELIHSTKVSELCVALSEKMELSKDEVNLMRLAGLMHDIGKIGISDKILNKADNLNNEEYTEIQKHPEIGYRILNSVNEFSEISEFVLEHQEKWDGTGYPQGLKGKEIKIEARIIAIADSYDAMTTKRSYHTSLSHEEAMDEIRRCSGTQFDPKIAAVFLEQVIK